MKALILLAATHFLIIITSGQQTLQKPAPNSPSKTIQEFLRKTQMHSTRPVHPWDKDGSGTRISATTFQQPQKLNMFTNKQLGVPGKVQSLGIPAVVPGTTCTNHAFFELIGLANSVIYVGAMTHTQDDGVVISGAIYDSTVTNPRLHTNAYVLKCDNSGNILWVTLLKDGNNDRIYFFSPIKIKEMPGGDLLLASYVDTSYADTSFVSYGSSVTTICHLTGGGSMLWHKELQSLPMQFIYEGPYFEVKDINPGLNGDYILSGTTISDGFGINGETVVRIDANGNYVWDVDLDARTEQNSAVVEGLTANMSNGKIEMIGVSHGNGLDASRAIVFTTLDYATGGVLGKRFWIYDYPGSPERVYTGAHDIYALQTNDGHYLVYGAMGLGSVMLTDTISYFGVQEFDATGTLLGAYSLSSWVHSPSYLNNIYFEKYSNIYFDKYYNGFVSITSVVNNSNIDFFSSIRNCQIVRQRVKAYGSRIESGFSLQKCFMNDGSYIVADEYNDPSSGDGLALKKMYDTDTASVCLGHDTLFLMKLPLNMVEDPNYNDLDSFVSGSIVQVNYAISDDVISSHISNPCLVNSFCSQVKISGQQAVCGGAAPQLYSFGRNGGCGATPQWNLDTAAVDSVTQVNDTTVSVYFRNINWAGKLYVSLPPGSCSLGTSDSLAINVVATPKALGLVPDTNLCTGDSIVLHAGPEFSSYLWQDGSTSPQYTVTKAGIYSVEAKTPVGCSGTDSISVAIIGVPKFNLGHDTTLCDGLFFTLQPGLPSTDTYLWQDGSTQPTMVVRTAGTYRLTATNVCGSSTGVLKVSPGLCHLLMPNEFTPNGDGHNDIFRVRYPFAVARFLMVVYNRWGQEVFRSNDMNLGWDGTINGTPAPAGAYVWNISLTDIDHKDQYQKGTVVLVR